LFVNSLIFKALYIYTNKLVYTRSADAQV